MSEGKRLIITACLILFGLPLAVNPELIPAALCGFAICAAFTYPEDRS